MKMLNRPCHWIKDRLKPFEKKYGSRLAAIFLLVLSAAVIWMTLTFRAEKASPENLYWLSSDTLVVIISCLLYYGCSKEIKLADQTTKRFTSLILCHGCAYFADALSCWAESLSLGTLNLAASCLYYSLLFPELLLFWRFSCALLSVEGMDLRGIRIETLNRIMLVALAFSLIINLLNLFIPLCYYVDEGGRFVEADGYFLIFLFPVLFVVNEVFIIVKSRASKADKIVMVICFVCSIAGFMISSIEDLSLFPDPMSISVLMVYVIVISNRSIDLAVTRADLNTAAKIQTDVLPRKFPAFPDRTEFDLFASMTPAREVGGDFYDFFLTDEDHLALVIADVSGKGIPAAMFMMSAKSLIQAQMLAGQDPAAALKNVNRQLSKGKSHMFVTVWLAVVELSTGKGISCNAGHEAPGIRRSGEAFQLLKYPHNLVVGALKKTEYKNREFTLHPGDCLFVYTDGIPEAINGSNEFFGEERLTKALNEDETSDPEEIIRHVHDAVNRFTDHTPQFDDITMLCCRYNGPNDPL